MPLDVLIALRGFRGPSGIRPNPGADFRCSDRRKAPRRTIRAPHIGCSVAYIHAATRRHRALRRWNRTSPTKTPVKTVIESVWSDPPSSPSGIGRAAHRFLRRRPHRWRKATSLMQDAGEVRDELGRGSCARSLLGPAKRGTTRARRLASIEGGARNSRSAECCDELDT